MGLNLSQMSRLTTEIEITISIISISKFFHEAIKSSLVFHGGRFDPLRCFYCKVQIFDEVCWGQRDPWTPLPRVMGLEEFEVVKNLVELLALERAKGVDCERTKTTGINKVPLGVG